MSERNYYSQALALQILLLPALLLLITASLFLVKIPISSFHFLSALVGTICISFVMVKKRNYFKIPGEYKSIEFIKVTFVFIILVSLGLFMGMQFYDFSQDGQAYHQPAIIALANGWNPFHEAFVEKYSPFYKNAMKGNEIYVDHYTKATWMTSAAVFRLTGSIESGKLFNFLYMIAVFLITWNFLFHFGRIPGKSKIIIAALVALNPVVLYQSFSFYNDCQMASLMSITLILAFQYIMFREEKRLFFLFITLLVLCNIKFTGLVYGALVIGLAWLTVLIVDREIQLRFILSMIAALLLAVVFIGFQPYITNIIYKKNPFYPALRIGSGQNKSIQSVVSNQAPEEFMKKDRFRKLYYSLFSASDNDLTHLPHLKIPFSIERGEMSAFRAVDARYGGFGPLFGSILILVIAAGVLVLLKARRLVVLFSFIPAALLLILTLLNPEAWWARFSPQLWLLPITFFVSFYYFSNPYLDYFRGFVISIMLLNCILIITAHAGYSITLNKEFKQQMAFLSKETRPKEKVLSVYPDVFYLSIQNRLRDFKIRHKMITDIKTCPPNTSGLIGTPNVQVWFK